MTVRTGAVVLAAGMSSRMGEAKQLLLLGENTLLNQVLDNVRGSKVAEIVVVLGHQAEIIEKQLGFKNLKVVVNESYQQGMATSLRTGLAALSSEMNAALIVLADQPFVRAGTLDRLMDQYEQSGAQIAIPVYKGFRGNPILLDRAVFPEVMALTGDIGCRAIFGDHVAGIVKVPVEDIGVLLDLDTKGDVAKLRDFRQGATDESVLIAAADLEGRKISNPENSRRDRELVIVGSEPVGIALAKLAKVLGFTITVVDPFLKPADLPGADHSLNSLDFSLLPAAAARYVVVASHGRFDEEAIEQALQANSAYVALVANKKRAQEIRRSLELRGESLEKLAKLHAPAGLNIGAENPEEIALSILGEIVSEIRRDDGTKSISMEDPTRIAR